MAKKAAPKKVAPKKAAPKKPPHHENVIQRVAEELEARFFEGAELATETSSAETNVALAALGAIEGPRDAKQPATPKASNAKRKRPRPKKR
jgi:hypothetical protein